MKSQREANVNLKKWLLLVDWVYHMISQDGFALTWRDDDVGIRRIVLVFAFSSGTWRPATPVASDSDWIRKKIWKWSWFYVTYSKLQVCVKVQVSSVSTSTVPSLATVTSWIMILQREPWNDWAHHPFCTGHRTSSWNYQKLEHAGEIYLLRMIFTFAYRSPHVCRVTNTHHAYLCK